MITLRERDHDFVWILNLKSSLINKQNYKKSYHCSEWNAGHFQQTRRNNVVFVAKKSLTSVMAVWKKLRSESFKTRRGLRRNCIPEFWRTIMQIINRVQVHVFDVPWKCRFPHTKIQINRIHARNSNLKPEHFSATKKILHYFYSIHPISFPDDSC